MVSAHLWYDVNRAKDVRAFECTLMVPAGNDPLKSYFMAVGFHKGYFGMQVNEPTVRRFLFSVWDTHDGMHKVEEVYAHPHAVVRPFGGEGTGLQSFLHYRWQPDTEYSFRVEAQPEEDSTIYTAKVRLNNEWVTISSLRSPKDGKYLESVYSFIENWGSDRSAQRKCHYMKQRYQRASTGDQYHPITKCRTTTTEQKCSTEHFFFGTPSDNCFMMCIDGHGKHDTSDCHCCQNPQQLTLTHPCACEF